MSRNNSNTGIIMKGHHTQLEHYGLLPGPHCINVLSAQVCGNPKALRAEALYSRQQCYSVILLMGYYSPI